MSSESTTVAGGSPRTALLTRYTLIGALAAAALVGAGLAIALGLGHHTASRGPGRHATSYAAARSPSPQPHPAVGVGREVHVGGLPSTSHGAGQTVSASGTAAVAEVRDPEESKSFPVSASVSAHHRAATSPKTAAEAVVAPGAASDAQIRRELHEAQRAQAQERAAVARALAPATNTSEGGSSIGGNGALPIPLDAPEVIQRVIAGGNAIADFPYIWGGGHGSFVDRGYDCSGSVSYALAAGGLLSAPLVSGELASWGDPGPGRWITIYANAGHTFMNVDGYWFDTAGRSGPYASRWILATPSLAGYAVRHPPGL